MKYFLLILLLIPLLSYAADKHIEVEEGRECVECHEAQYKDWQGSAHGVNVMCFICHGSVDKNFKKRADLNKCNGCHQDFVKDVKNKKVFKDCFECHNGHTLKIKFHNIGGK